MVSRNCVFYHRGLVLQIQEGEFACNLQIKGKSSQHIVPQHYLMSWVYIRLANLYSRSGDFNDFRFLNDKNCTIRKVFKKTFEYSLLSSCGYRDPSLGIKWDGIIHSSPLYKLLTWGPRFASNLFFLKK